jgi:signal transduction histidine kinase
LDGGDLRHALEQVVAQARRAGSDCVLVWEPQCRPPTGDAAWQMLRIAQEAVTNAQRHAGTGQITIACRRDGQAILLSITDQGPGLLSGNPDGLGLRIMRARARRIAADLIIDGRSPSGTRVTCRWTPSPATASPEVS